MRAWPQQIRRDPLWLGRPRLGHTSSHTAPDRTVSLGIACGDQWRASHTRATGSLAASDPAQGIRCG
jgi:hypothetical protein